MSSLTYSTQLRCVRFVFPNALSFQVLIDFVNMHIRPCKNYTREYFMRKSNRMLAKMLLVLMQNRTRSRIYQIEFYSVKMIDQAFGLVCMGASARACVCISAHIWVAVEIQTHEFGLLDHISVHINQVNAISICGEKRIKRQITLCSERQMQVYALPNRCWSVLGFILLLCYFCALSAFFLVCCNGIESSTYTNTAVLLVI